MRQEDRIDLARIAARLESGLAEFQAAIRDLDVVTDNTSTEQPMTSEEIAGLATAASKMRRIIADHLSRQTEEIGKIVDRSIGDLYGEGKST